MTQGEMFSDLALEQQYTNMIKELKMNEIPTAEENDVSNFKCMGCLSFESLKVGEWYQTADGEYHQKNNRNN